MSADITLFGWDHPMRPTKAKRGQPKGTAAQMGGGPRRETCGTCEDDYCVAYAKRYHKCRLVKATGGPGTDIRLKWAACSRFEKRKGEA